MNDLVKFLIFFLSSLNTAYKIVNIIILIEIYQFSTSCFEPVLIRVVVQFEISVIEFLNKT